MHQGGHVDLATEAFQPVIPPIYTQELNSLRSRSHRRLCLRQAAWFWKGGVRELLEPGGWVWLPCKYMALHPSSQGAPFSYSWDGGPVPAPPWVQAHGGHRDTRLCAASPAHSSHPEGCSPWLHVPPPRHSLLPGLLIWHLETLGDKQCHLREEHGKSQGCREPAGGPTLLGG